MRCIQRATSHTPARHNHESPAAARGPTAIRTTEPKTRRGSQTSEATRKWYNLLLEVQSFGNVDASSPTQKLPPFNLYYSTIVYLLELDVAGRQTARPHATRARTFAAGRRRLTPRDSLSPSRLRHDGPHTTSESNLRCEVPIRPCDACKPSQVKPIQVKSSQVKHA